jgi:hypothetical protein
MFPISQRFSWNIRTPNLFLYHFQLVVGRLHPPVRFRLVGNGPFGGQLAIAFGAFAKPVFDGAHFFQVRRLQLGVFVLANAELFFIGFLDFFVIF